MRGFESYNSTRKKLLDNATNALQYINTKAADNGRKRQREYDNSNVNLPAAKRPATDISVQGHSLAVQVSLFIHVHCNKNYVQLITTNANTDPNRL